MIVLGIESSNTAASCAVTSNEKLLGEFTLNHTLTHSEKLMPLIVDLLTSLSLDINEVALIAIDEGPGSYTGLRIGAALIKGMAYQNKIPIVTLTSTEALASNIQTEDIPIVTMIDARGDRVYYGSYMRKTKGITCLEESQLATIDPLLEQLADRYDSAIFVGDGSKKHMDRIIQVFSDKGKKCLFSYHYDDVIKAYSLCYLGLEKFLKGDYVNPSDYVPNYLRPSQAERNLTNDR